MTKKTLFKTLALVSILAMTLSTFGVTPVTRAAANEFVATVTAPTNGTQNASTTVTMTFVASTSALAAGTQIVVTVPSDFSGFSTLTAGDVSFNNASGTIVSAASTTLNTATQSITGVVATSSLLTDTITVTIGGTNQLRLPVAAGQYSIHITTLTGAGAVADTGYGIVNVANNVTINAVVDEALIMTINASNVLLTADPSVNSGIDYSQKSVLTVKTNAANGYAIQGKLNQGIGATSSAPALLGAATLTTIGSGNPIATVNKFGYVAYNGDGVGSPANGTTTPVAARAQTDFATDAGAFTAFASSSASLVKAIVGGGSVAPSVGLSAATNGNVHTVYYGLKVDYLTPADTYQGTVTYTAAPTF